MKKILKFQLKDLLIGCSIFALVLFLLTFLFIGISFKYDNINVTSNGNGFTSAIFCLALGLGMYKEHCQMAVTNSVARKDFFKSLMCITLITGLLCTLIVQVLKVINRLPGLNSAYNHNFANNFDFLKILQMLYPEFSETQSAVMMTAAVFLLEFLINSLSFLTGTLIAGIYLRIPGKYRVAYCIALPVFGCGVFPLLFIAGSSCPESLSWISNAFLGVMGISSGNPFLGALTFTVTSVIIAGICYRVLRRTEIV